MMGRNGIVVVFAALAVGAAAGWLAEGMWNGMGQSPRAARWSAPTDDGRARSPSAPDGRACRSAIADAKPHQESEAPSEKRREPDAAKQEEKPAQAAQPELQKDDNSFPRYLDMFKNNPEALTATFLALWWEISLMKVQ